MEISGRYPLLTNEDRRGFQFYERTMEEKAKIKRAYDRKHFGYIELPLYAFGIAMVIALMILPQFPFEIGLTLIMWTIITWIFSIYKSKKRKKIHLPFIYTEVYCLKKEEFQPNDMGLYPFLAKDIVSGYEGLLYCDEKTYDSLIEYDEDSDDNKAYEIDIDDRYANYTPVSITTSIKRTMFKKIF